MDIGSVDIAAASTQMKSAQVQQKVDIAVLKQSMDVQTEVAQMLIEQISQVNVSSASGHVDIGV